MLLATHIVSDIEAIAKEILLLKSGNVIEIDTPGPRNTPAAAAYNPKLFYILCCP